MREVFSRMSNSDALVAYKMLGAEHNLAVRSNFAPVPVPRGSVTSSSGSSKKTGPNRGVQPKADSAIVEMKASIAALNKKISAASASAGRKLDDSHPLLVERGHLFRALKELKSTTSSSH